MKYLQSLLFGLVILTGVVAAETAVIVHPSNATALDQAEANKIFLGKSKSFPDGGSATPVNQTEDSPARTAFDDAVLGKSSSQVKAYWSKLVFTGKGTPPEELSGDAAVKAKVASDTTAVGYVDASSVDSSVRVAFTF